MSDSIAIGWLGPTNDCWKWLLSHFRDVSLLTERNVESWLVSNSQPADKHDALVRLVVLLVAVESRCDSTVDCLFRIEQEVAPKLLSSVPICVLLGEDWVGHRRTFPLPETLTTFYWYELYDRILPWLLSLRNSATEKLPIASSPTDSKRRISPRVQRLIDVSLATKRRLQIASPQPLKMAMIVSETATTRELWSDALREQGIQCVGTTPNNLEVWTQPDFVVVDLETEPLAIRQSLDLSKGVRPREQLIRQLTRQFPSSLILVIDSFPRWTSWCSLLDCGADLIVGKPYLLTGIFDTLVNVVPHASPSREDRPV